MRDRLAIAQHYGFTLKEIYGAIDSWRKLYVRQPTSSLTLEEYLGMMKDAGLRPSMVGLRRGQYHLARYGDAGAYHLHSCRFIPQEQNQKERKEGYQATDSFRKMASELALLREKTACENCGCSFSPGMYARWHGGNCRKAA